MGRNPVQAETVAEAYLRLLAARGVEYFFANAGTDFAPVIEALANAALTNTPVPKPILATHEHVAASMAHGYAMVSGKIPAVMVHVSVGTGNTICAALNAARENVPILLSAGRSPITEEGLAGARDAYIHWGQEMYDQAGMVREIVKWEYELRNAAQLATVVDRALNIAATEPCGPVYLSLPREVIAAPATETGYDDSPPRVAPAPPRPDAGAMAAAARILAAAENPLIVTINAGRDKAAVAALAEFAERFAIPVVQHKPRYMALPSDHPMHLGFDPGSLVGEADAILALEADVPWIPSRAAPRDSCKVIHAGLEPLFPRYPIRGFRCDLAVAGAARAILADLGEALGRSVERSRVEARRGRIARLRTEQRAAWEKLAHDNRATRPLHPAWISHCIDAAKGENAILVNEYTLLPEHCRFVAPGSFFGSSGASGLGWGLGAALGAKLAAPDKLVIATLGDGAYIFGNPVAAHHAAKAHGLPILTVVFNNAMWNAVRKATLDMYPGGQAAKSNKAPFIHLDDLPAFEQVCAAAGGYGERVEDPAELPEALARAIAAVTKERRQALLNVICQTP
ncbi:MAG TPA: thiamine pyrophosphate-requiring protein [Alphaproteobacteria bacterium]|nr:thiamine pyrophosphate-requiring protein [Alphaproteobacteria bacterium]